MHIAHRGTNEKNEKLGLRASERCHVTYFCNFGTTSISRERYVLETSNLACRLTTRGTNEKNAKLGQRGSKRVEKRSSDLLLKFWDPINISGTV